MIPYGLNRSTSVGRLSPSDSASDHIYEEIIDSDTKCEESEDGSDEEISFLALISSERRRNLQMYGSTDWDFNGIH